jgi:hypothetical protein
MSIGDKLDLNALCCSGSAVEGHGCSARRVAHETLNGRWRRRSKLATAVLGRLPPGSNPLAAKSKP